MKEQNFIFNFRLVVVLSMIILVSTLVGIFIFAETNIILNQRTAEAKEAARPANLEFTVIKDSECKECFDLQQLTDFIIKNQNVAVNKERTLERTSPEGVELIKRFNIITVPTILISGEIEKDAKLKKLLSEIGEIQDNTFVLRKMIGAPYVSLASGEIRGKAEFLMLADPECVECYDVTQHEGILRGFGFIQGGRLIDSRSAEGLTLIRKYRIKLLPTIILTGDIDAYPAIKTVWPGVGTVEKDGAHIFREGVKQMGTYKDLAAGKIVKPGK